MYTSNQVKGHYDAIQALYDQGAYAGFDLVRPDPTIHLSQTQLVNCKLRSLAADWAAASVQSRDAMTVQAYGCRAAEICSGITAAKVLDDAHNEFVTKAYAGYPPAHALRKVVDLEDYYGPYIDMATSRDLTV